VGDNSLRHFEWLFCKLYGYRDIKSDVPETARIIVCFILGAAGFFANG